MLRHVLKASGMFFVLGLIGMASYGYVTARGDLEELALPSAPIQQEEANQTLAPTIPPGQSEDGFALRPVTDGLEWPLEVLEGPDGFIWVTERVGKRVTRIDPDTGEQRVAVTIWEAYQSAGQDGVLGMVFHPEFLQGTGNDYVYLSYTYVPDTSTEGAATEVMTNTEVMTDTEIMTDTAGVGESQELTGTEGVDDSQAVTATEDDESEENNTGGVGDQGPAAEDQPSEQTGSEGPEAEDPDDPSAALEFRRVKIVRYTYEPENQILVDPVDILTGLPGSNDHNSAKLVFSPDNMLFYSIGDQGNNQFDRFCLPIRSQELPTAEEVNAGDYTKYAGKILRLNLDGSIPEDNPTINGVQSHIYSYGHRNVQGLALGPNNQLYASEHGPKTDDEVNLIQPGMNYGWPYVVGYQDDQAYVYANWSAAEDCASLTFSNFQIPDSVPVQQESEWSDPNFVPPIYTFGTVPDDHNFQPEICAPNFNMCWPTVAPTGIAVYSAPAGTGPGWSTSLLVTALKSGAVWRLELNEDGTAVVGEAEQLFKTINRYRDILINADGGTFYVITDSGNTTQGSFGLPTAVLEYPGALLEFHYMGSE
jgi:PQQ-dependent dehydrogenase (s-GDH family)